VGALFRLFHRLGVAGKDQIQPADDVVDLSRITESRDYVIRLRDVRLVAQKDLVGGSLGQLSQILPESSASFTFSANSRYICLQLRCQPAGELVVIHAVLRHSCGNAVYVKLNLGVKRLAYSADVSFRLQVRSRSAEAEPASGKMSSTAASRTASTVFLILNGFFITCRTEYSSFTSQTSGYRDNYISECRFFLPLPVNARSKTSKIKSIGTATNGATMTVSIWVASAVTRTLETVSVSILCPRTSSLWVLMP
jgi:hypothetical protein